jgi:hypothetical protein
MEPYHRELVTYFFINPANTKGYLLSTVVLRPTRLGDYNTRKYENSKENKEPRANVSTGLLLAQGQ